jgi:hypothetical protein
MRAFGSVRRASAILTTMGIRFYCPACGHKLNVKSFLAGKRGVCPQCGSGLDIPLESNLNKDAGSKQPDDEETGPSTLPMSVPLSLPTSPRPAPGLGASSPSPLAAPAPLPTPASIPMSPRPLPMSGPSSVSPHPAPAPTEAAPRLTVPMSNPQRPAGPSLGPPGGGAPLPGTGAMTSTGAAAGAPAWGPNAPSVPMRPATPFQAVMPVAAPMTAAPAAVAPVDPIEEAPQAIWYVRPPSGGQYGPARGDIMRKWMTEGRVSSDSLVWREGWEDWRTASHVFPSLGASVTPPMPAPVAPVSYAASPTPAYPPGTAARRGRHRSSPMVAITVVTVLGLMCVALFVALVFILTR